MSATEQPRKSYLTNAVKKYYTYGPDGVWLVDAEFSRQLEDKIFTLEAKITELQQKNTELYERIIQSN